MATTISSSTDELTPLLVDGFRAARESGNVLHSILGASSHSVTVRPAKPRSGTLRTLWATFTLAAACEAMLSAGDVFTLASTDRSEIGMDFVINGRITLELDNDTRKRAWVSFDYQEIT